MERAAQSAHMTAFSEAGRHLRFESRLASPAPEVWDVVGTMQGVNDELAPRLRMSTPPGLEDLRIEDAPLDRVLFSSWVLFGPPASRWGVPLDRHHLRLERVEPGRGFHERSTSWTERSWVHERTIDPLDDRSCRLVDRLELTPRIAIAAPVLERVVQLVFRHRHARLAKRFGRADGGSG